MSSSAEKARKEHRNSKAGAPISRSSIESAGGTLSARSTGHTLSPSAQGRHVAVVGDGWGGGAPGGYEAIVTEADNKTFTVIAVNGDDAWKETHVLQDCCIMLSERAISELEMEHVPQLLRAKASKMRRLS